MDQGMPCQSLFLNPAILTVAKLTAEALLHEVMEPVAQGFELDLVNDLTNESKLQKQLSLMLVDTALLHIEKRSVVELSHRRAMSTLHVVGIDLQHRLSVHPRRLCHHKILICFLRCCLLTAMPNEHSTGKGTDGLPVEHIFIEFMRIAVSHLMIDERVVVDMLTVVSNDATVAPALSALALEDQVEFVACHAIS